MNIVNKQIPRNFRERSRGVDAIVIHIAEGTLTGAENWFGYYQPNPQVSAHYMVGKRGEIWQFVDEKYAAYHAGGINRPSELYKQNHGHKGNPNDFTIGIENEGFTGQTFTNANKKSLQDLVYDIAKRRGWSELVYGVNIIGHNEINSVSRGRCPGTGIHLTNDLILPVNERLKMSGGIVFPEDLKNDYFEALMRDREDDEIFAQHGYNASNIDQWFYKEGNMEESWGYAETIYSLGINGYRLPADRSPLNIMRYYVKISNERASDPDSRPYIF